MHEMIPMHIELPTVTNPQAGVMATNPITTPLQVPTTLFGLYLIRDRIKVRVKDRISDRIRDGIGLGLELEFLSKVR
jgi:hypothetical protein